MNFRIGPEQVSRVAVLGAGTIGASWTAYFVWRGFHVRIVDPLVSTERLNSAVGRHLVSLRKLGSPVQEAGFTHAQNLEMASRGAEFVQECVAENLEAKQLLLAQVETFLDPSTVICSSTTALMPSEIQAACQHPERVLVGHPFNPPHLLPLVEVVAGQQTAFEVVEWALAFYRHIGKHPIRVNREVKGHIANRLTSALFREAVHLLVEGVASAEDVDAAITQGPGLRWALMGPFLIYHLAGGPGGIEGYLAHLGDSHPARWAQLGSPSLDESARNTVIQSVLEAYGSQTFETLSGQRDNGLTDLLQLQNSYRLAMELKDASDPCSNQNDSLPF